MEESIVSSFDSFRENPITNIIDPYTGTLELLNSSGNLVQLNFDGGLLIKIDVLNEK